MPYRFESKINILYCKDCDSLYLMKSHYEASSKIDFEDIEFILKKDYFKAKPEYQADGADKFTAIFREMVDKKLNPVGQAIVGDKTGLTVTFVDLKDNTEGAEVLQQCEEVGKPVKWYNKNEK